MGSGEWVKAAVASGTPLTKVILETYENRSSLGIGERDHVLARMGDPLCRNRKVPSPEALTLTGYRGDTQSPRQSVAPTHSRKTPDTQSPKPLRTTSTSEPNGSSVSRATRLPEGFDMPESWIAWAMTKRRWPRSAAVDEAEGFTEYWQARPGAAARKLDWEKTWHNWVRNSRRDARQGWKTYDPDRIVV